jgi:hypothetical protein
MAPRIKEALRRHAYEKGEDLTWRALGRRVWEETLRDGLVAKSKLSLIKNSGQEPDAREGAAIAFVLDCSPMWLVWGYGEIGRFPDVEIAPAADISRSARKTAGHVVSRGRVTPHKKKTA